MEHHSPLPAYGPRATAEPSLIESICTVFSLGKANEVQDVGGTYNLNLRVTTEQDSFIIRIHRPWVTAQRLSHIHSIRQRLALRGLPILLPLLTQYGATSADFDGRLVEVEQFVPHTGTTDSWKRFSIALEVLGHLHSALLQETDPVSCIAPRVRNYGTPIELDEWTKRSEARIRDEPKSNTSSTALELCLQTRTLLLLMIDWWNLTGVHLPQQVCHGDYGGENVLFHHDTVAAILDFDFLGIQERVFDIGYCLYWAFCRLTSPDEPEHWDWKHLPTLLKHYESVTNIPLSAVERKALPMTMARVPLYWIAEAGLLPDVAQNVVAHAQYVRNAQWLLDHQDDILKYLDDDGL